MLIHVLGAELLGKNAHAFAGLPSPGARDLHGLHSRVVSASPQMDTSIWILTSLRVTPKDRGQGDELCQSRGEPRPGSGACKEGAAEGWQRPGRCGVPDSRALSPGTFQVRLPSHCAKGCHL
jgi:hypothetical protein